MINKVQSYQNKPAFTALKINEEAIRKAGAKVFNGVRQTLIPEEGQLSSKMQRLAVKCDVYIGSSEPEKEILYFSVTRSNTTRHIENFETKGYNSEVELGNAIYKEIEDTYKDIGRMTHSLVI